MQANILRSYSFRSIRSCPGGKLIPKKAEQWNFVEMMRERTKHRMVMQVEGQSYRIEFVVGNMCQQISVSQVSGLANNGGAHNLRRQHMFHL